MGMKLLRITPKIAALATFTILCRPAHSAPVLVDFDQQIHPILAAKCLPCHSAEKRSGGLSLASYNDVLDGGRSGAAVKPGNSAASLLTARITGETKPQMPFGGTPLSEAEINVIRGWIDQGARATPTSAAAKPKWEAPLFLEPPAKPPIVWKNWTSPIDLYVAAYLAKNGASEPELISDATFARRAYLDIWGLLPPPSNLKSFLEDRDVDKRQKLVSRLLADNQNYAENWISYWNDLLRNDEGVSYYSETASRKSISDWLLAALKTNLPYNEFVRQLLNPARAADPEGFLIGVNWRGTVSASQTPAMQAAQNSAQIFLGVNLKCNSCHDSFISRWKLRDAYALASFFSTEEKLQLHRCDVAQGQYATPAFLYPELNRIPPSNSSTDRRSTAADIFTDPRNGRLARTLVNRIWLRLMGHGIVENPDDMDGEPWSPELLDNLSSDFVVHGDDLKFLIAEIVSSRTYQMVAVSRSDVSPHKYVFNGPEVRRVTAEEMADAIGAITGEWHTVQPEAAGSRKNNVPLPAEYSRDWHVAATSFTRALGRPIRDQVYSTRETDATTLQALEVVNGETLTHWLLRGARKMTGQLPPEPASIFDHPLSNKGGPYPFDVDITGATHLYLLVQDTGSYSPEKVEAIWDRAELVSPAGVKLLSELRPLDPAGLREGGTGIRVKTPSQLAYDISGKGFTRLRGSAHIENVEITSDLNPDIRFLIFKQQPDPDRLTPVAAETPLEPGPVLRRPAEAVDRVFNYALGRAPSPEERRTATSAIADPSGNISPEGLADLLWAVLVKPEFQLIY
jgi:hypothetical protein